MFSYTVIRLYATKLQDDLGRMNIVSWHSFVWMFGGYRSVDLFTFELFSLRHEC